MPDVDKAVDAMDLLLDQDLDTLDWIVGGKEPQTPRPSKAIRPTFACLHSCGFVSMSVCGAVGSPGSPSFPASSLQTSRQSPGGAQVRAKH